MDSRITTASRADVVLIESSPRPTPAPPRVSFGQVLAAGAAGLVAGAEAATARLPGAPLAAAAVRAATSGGLRAGGVGAPEALSMGASFPADLAPEGASNAAGSAPSLGAVASVASAAPAAPASAGANDPSTGIDASLQQSAQLNLYYLQVQQQVDAQNRSFTALSNVLKTEHDSAKAAIQNIHA
jgi:hypothetical protein